MVAASFVPINQTTFRYNTPTKRKGINKMSELKNGEFGIDMEKEKVLWTDRKRRTIFALPLSFTKYTVTESKLIIQSGCFNLKEDEIQLYRV